MPENRDIPAFRWQFKQNEPKRLAFSKGKTAESFALLKRKLDFFERL
jgi:hypothetical protein